MRREPKSPLDHIDRWFRLDMPFPRFLLNTLYAALAGLLPVLAVFVARSPGFAEHLVRDPDAALRLARQIVTNGVPVIFAVNFIGFALFAGRGNRGAMGALAIDLAARPVAFIGLHAVIYPASALWFGSFGGDPAQALTVLGPTLAQSAAFANLSGVYLYATALGALPLLISALVAALRDERPAGQLLRRAIGRYPGAGRLALAVGFALMSYLAIMASLVTIGGWLLIAAIP